MYESVYDELALDSPVSISSKLLYSQVIEDHDGDSGECDEQLLATPPVMLQKPINTKLPSVSHSSLVDSTKDLSDIAQTPVFPPVRPTNARFPMTMFSSKARSFNPL